MLGALVRRKVSMVQGRVLDLVVSPLRHSALPFVVLVH